jgi:hypothetical protein
MRPEIKQYVKNAACIVLGAFLLVLGMFAIEAVQETGNWSAAGLLSFYVLIGSSAVAMLVWYIFARH